MILSCPNCGTRFVADPRALGAEGRMVRCGACGHNWFQAPPSAAPPEPPPLVLDDIVTTPVETIKRRRGRTLTRMLSLFLFFFVIAALLGGAYKYRADVVAFWPRATKLYELVGIPVAAPTGFGLRVVQETVKFERVLAEGKRVLVIKGEVENNSTQPRKVGRILIVLAESENGPPLREVAVPAPDADRVLAPGERMPFTVSVPDPPEQAKAVTFKVLIGE